MFMRVRRTVPQFTFSLSARFVNGISSVSTGFFRFFPVLFGFEVKTPLKMPCAATTALYFRPRILMEERG